MNPVNDQLTPPPAMFCRRCFHDLRGINPRENGESACPECARAFDSAQPRSFARRQRSRAELILLRRIAPVFLVVLLGFWLLWHAWIPRPIALFGGWGATHSQVRSPSQSTLWIWTGKLYGPATIWTGLSNAEAWVWEDRVRRVRGYDRSSGELAWEVLWDPQPEADGGGLWTARILRPIPQDFDFLGGFRATRERMLGILLGDHDPQLTIEPFEVSGSEADLLSAYIRATGISIRPIQNDEDQSEFWVFDEDLERLILVDRDELDRRGIVPHDRSGLVMFGRSLAP